MIELLNKSDVDIEKRFILKFMNAYKRFILVDVITGCAKISGTLKNGFKKSLYFIRIKGPCRIR
jgi:hypothetical protein